MQIHQLKLKPFSEFGFYLLKIRLQIKKPRRGCLKSSVAWLTIAVNGLEAIEMINQASYDIVFMDVHMPQMDGIEASREIRRMEGDRHRIPIIAMTANGMSGDREICLEAGMDDYISKPVSKDKLMEAIQKWGEIEKATADKQAFTQAPSYYEGEGEEVFNYREALSRYGGEYEILKTIIDGYLVDTEERLRKIAPAIKEMDIDTVYLIAHSIKGGASYIGADGLRKRTQEIEEAAKKEKLENIELLMEKINEDFKTFFQMIWDFNWP